jgi:site-specific DNA-methyltransferase (adenine-specific)
MKLLLGDCLDKLKELEADSVDSIVTDPPYGLSFMGKKWDYDVPSQAIWEECMRVLKPGGHLLAFAGSRTYHRMAIRVEDAGFEIRDQIMWVYGSGFPKSYKLGDGWGTALKPAHEPIVMARKPISKNTIAENVSEWGTGGLNIGESRIAFRDDADYKESTQKNQHADFGTKPMTNNNVYGDYSMLQPKNYEPEGRFPANIIFDEEASKLLDEQSSSDVGGASRFFYCPKSSKKDRNEGADNKHPTVKPTDLMLYLIRLITPKGGTTLDPFMGSGSTGKAAVRGGFEFVGIEREKEYFDISENRIKYEINNPYKEEKNKRVEIKTEVVEKINKFFV